MPKRTVKDGSKALEKALKELHGRSATQGEVTQKHTISKVKKTEHERAKQSLNKVEEQTEYHGELVDEFIMGRKKPDSGDWKRERTLLQVQCVVHQQTWIESLKEALGKAKSIRP